MNRKSARRRAPRNAGGAETLILLTVALLAALWGAAVSRSPEWLLPVATVVAAAAILAECRRDPHDLAMYGIVVSAVVAICTGTALAMDANTSGVRWSLAASVGVLALCGSVLLRVRTGRDAFPDFLADTPVFETAGVLFAFQPVLEDDPPVLVLRLQNASTGSRQVSVDVLDKWGRPLGAFPPAQVALGPLEFGTLRLPLAPTWSRDRVEGQLSIRVAGRSGSRRRKRRGRAVSPRRSPAFVLATIAVLPLHSLLELLSGRLTELTGGLPLSLAVPFHATSSNVAVWQLHWRPAGIPD